MKRTLGTWLLAACAAAAGCSGSPPAQVVTGNVTTTGAVAVRAIANGQVVTASRVRSDGSFTLALPAGARYRLEVLSPSGVTRVVDHAAADITFAVCAPTDPFDMGTVGTGGPGCDPAGNCPPPCDPATDANCKPPPPPCDPTNDAGCPPPCDPATDANCKPPPPPCDPATDANCPPPCDPTSDPNCPPPCDPTTDANCPPPPPPCDPTTDANCPPPPPPCDPTSDPNCPPPCDPTTDAGCKPPPCDPAAGGTCPCDPMTDASCPTPPPPCTDPNDPTTCKDPCMDDPALCGCGGPDTAGNDPGGCWPPPCDGPDCGSGGGCHPNNPPPDFGCKDPSGA